MTNLYTPEMANEPASITSPHPIGHNNPPPDEGPSLNDLLTSWHAAKAAAVAATDEENRLRKAVSAKAFPNAKEKGTERVDIGYGKELKRVGKLNYTIDRDGLAAAIKRGVDPDVLEKVVKYKPEVVESEFLKVENTKLKLELASFITSKPGMPSIEIVDAKK